MKVISLEALRAFASIYVFFHHTLYRFELLEPNTFLWRLFSFGQEAVMIFFLLSGYVIAISLYKNDYSFKTYFRHRFIRIYPIVFVSFIVSYVSYCWLLGNEFPSSSVIVVNLFMLQDKPEFTIGAFAEPIFDNQPLWSLSYEWWFYMVFFLQYFLFRKYSLLTNLSITLVITLMSILTYYLIPNQVSAILMYYYIWFVGVVLYSYYNGDQKDKRSIYLLFFGFLTITAFYSALFLPEYPYQASVLFPYIKLRHYAAAFLFVLFLILFFQYIKNILEKDISKYLIIKLSKLAPISFSIYVLHYPVMKAVKSFEMSGLQMLFVTATITLLLSYVSEQVMYNKLRRRFK